MVERGGQPAGTLSGQHGRVFGLDLVRGIAVLGVLVAHYSAFIRAPQDKPSLLAMLYGELGVDLFFVLSGFLIGGLLIEVSEQAPNWQGWLRFMIRRWMRILPLYFLWIVVVLVLAKVTGQHIQRPLAYAVFLQNFAWPMPGDSQLTISWSLSVEEWFYLLFSATLLGLAAFRPRRALVVSCATFIVVPLCLRVAFGDAANFDLGLRRVAVYRLDAIAYGVVVIGLYRCWPQWLNRMRWGLFATGLALVWLALRTGPAMIFTLLPLAMALLLPAMFALARPWRFVDAAIHWLSTRSYGIYLIHLNVMWASAWFAARTGLVDWRILAAGSIAATFVLVDLLYRYFERPILALRPAQFPPEANPARPMPLEGRQSVGRVTAVSIPGS